MNKIIKILHLEDDEKDALLIHETINSALALCNIKRVENKTDFSEALRNEKFDLIISDFALPSFNGLEALTIARDIAPDIPYIYVSGYIGEERAIEALKMGATDYVLKDKPAKLIPAIYRALREIEERDKRREAEIALKESERFSRSTLDSVRNQLGVIEESGKILFTNKMWKENFNKLSPIPQGLFEGENYLYKCNETKEGKKFAAGIMSVINGLKKEYAQEYSYSLHGRIIWFVSFASKFEDEGPVRLIITHVDITDRKNAIERIELSEKRYKALFDQSPNAILEYTYDGRVIAANKQVIELTGTSIDEPGKIHLTNSLTEEGKKTASEYYRRTLEGKSYNFDLQAVTKDGALKIWNTTSIPIIINNKIEGVFGVIQDVTEERLSEEKIRKYISQLETAISVEQKILSSDFNINSIMNLIIGNAQEITQADGATIGMVENEEINFRVYSGIYNNFEPLKLNINSSLSGQCYKTGEFIICQDTYKNEIVNQKVCRKMGIRSLFIFPLNYNNKIVGILNIAYKKPNAVREEFISLMKLLLVFLASAMSLAEKFEANKRLTEEKTKALEQLKQSEELYRNLFEAAPIGIARISPEGHFLDSNMALQEMLDYSAEEFKNMEIVDITFNDDKANTQMLLNSALSSGNKIIKFEKRYVNKHGKSIWVNITSTAVKNAEGEILYLITMVENINDKKAADLALKESEEKYRMLFEKNLAGVYLSTIEGRIISCNHAFAAIYGYNSPEEILSIEASNLYTKNAGRDQYMEFLIREHSLRNFEFIGKKKNGDTVWLLENVDLENDYNGNPAYIFGTLLDITERKKAEANILQAKEKAEEMSRLKSSFLANMSHELRTPLIGILGFSQILNEELTDTEHKEMTETILKSGNRLLDTLNLILDLSRIEADKIDMVPESFDAVDTIKELIKLHKTAAENKGLSLQFTPKLKLLELNLDKQIFIEIVENIINNAIKFTLKGCVTVQVQEEKHRGKRMVVLNVIDTGIGIPSGSIKYIFDEFRQVSEGYSRSFEGSGLGLTITKKFVDKLGGKIAVESEEGRGSVFTVKLPVNMNTDENSEITENSANPSIDGKPPKTISSNGTLNSISKQANEVEDSSKQKILLVEDDETSRLLTGMYLKAKYEVDNAINAREAIHKTSEKKYDIILMDINLGAGMNGTDAAKEIRKNPFYKNKPIIAITAYAMKGDKEKFIAAGLSNYLSKPFTKAQLLNVIEESQK